jgi:hypothetical protein
MKTNSRRLVVFRAADIAQLVFRGLLEPFDSQRVLEHRKHFSTELLQTRNGFMSIGRPGALCALSPGRLVNQNVLAESREIELRRDAMLEVA